MDINFDYMFTVEEVKELMKDFPSKRDTCSICGEFIKDRRTG